MDNVVKSLIESTGANLIYLPFYSLEFNQIEEMWSKIKNSLKNPYRTFFQELIATICLVGFNM